MQFRGENKTQVQIVGSCSLLSVKYKIAAFLNPHSLSFSGKVVLKNPRWKLRRTELCSWHRPDQGRPLSPASLSKALVGCEPRARTLPLRDCRGTRPTGGEEEAPAPEGPQRPPLAEPLCSSSRPSALVRGQPLLPAPPHRRQVLSNALQSLLQYTVFMQDELNTNFFATLLFMHTYKIYNDAQSIQHKDYKATPHTHHQGGPVHNPGRTGRIMKIQSTVYLTK